MQVKIGKYAIRFPLYSLAPHTFFKFNVYVFIDQKLFDTTNEHLAAHESKFELKSQAFEWMMSPFEWNYNILGLMNLNILIDFKMLFEQWSKIFAWLEVEIILNRMHSFNRRVNAWPIQIFIGNPWISARLFGHRIRFLMHLIWQHFWILRTSIIKSWFEKVRILSAVCVFKSIDGQCTCTTWNLNDTELRFFELCAFGN